MGTGKGTSYRLAIVTKGFLKLSNLLMLINKIIYHFVETLGVGTFDKFTNNVPSKSESDIPPPYNGSLLLSLASGKAKFLLISF